MAFDVDDVLPTMLDAAKGPLAEGWATVEPFARSQFTNIAQQIATIAAQRELGNISQEDATDLLEAEKEAGISTLAAIEGVGEVAAETAVNNALSAISGLVNGAVGFAIL